MDVAVSDRLPDVHVHQAGEASSMVGALVTQARFELAVGLIQHQRGVGGALQIIGEVDLTVERVAPAVVVIREPMGPSGAHSQRFAGVIHRGIPDRVDVETGVQVTHALQVGQVVVLGRDPRAGDGSGGAIHSRRPLREVRPRMVGGNSAGGGSTLRHHLEGHLPAFERISVGVEDLHGDNLGVGILEISAAPIAVVRRDSVILHGVAPPVAGGLSGVEHLVGFSVTRRPGLQSPVVTQFSPLERLGRVTVLRVLGVIDNRVHVLETLLLRGDLHPSVAVGVGLGVVVVQHATIETLGVGLTSADDGTHVNRLLRRSYHRGKRCVGRWLATVTDIGEEVDTLTLQRMPGFPNAVATDPILPHDILGDLRVVGVVGVEHVTDVDHTPGGQILAGDLGVIHGHAVEGQHGTAGVADILAVAQQDRIVAQEAVVDVGQSVDVLDAVDVDAEGVLRAHLIGGIVAHDDSVNRVPLLNGVPFLPRQAELVHDLGVHDGLAGELGLDPHLGLAGRIGGVNVLVLLTHAYPGGAIGLEEAHALDPPLHLVALDGVTEGVLDGQGELFHFTGVVHHVSRGDGVVAGRHFVRDPVLDGPRPSGGLGFPVLIGIPVVAAVVDVAPDQQLRIRVACVVGQSRHVGVADLGGVDLEANEAVRIGVGPSGALVVGDLAVVPDFHDLAHRNLAGGDVNDLEVDGNAGQAARHQRNR
ncbi:MAG: hypothetical protein BWY79_01286 [Actinobacteria bacterium ADurb.Bin444]|nr:MAG: hypothetical protein BWY79_01286 [Actinobacteria bacterium ADurb.Bin444]